MTEPSRAVFLSYASQDAEAAQRICEALRAAGIEVWFDQSELRGGDAWDQSIRKQIRTCALFLPVISHTTHDRREGYFRLEWKLAVDRCHLMDAGMAFLLPVTIDDTRDDDERVPERFREVQWTRLPGGATPTAFVERVRRLLSAEHTSPDEALPQRAGKNESTAPQPRPGRTTGFRVVLLLAGLVGAVVAGFFALEHFVLQGHWRASKPVVIVKSQPDALAPIPAKSVAVLPFVDLSERKDQEYFADGMAEEILDSLAKIPGLRVIGRTSSFQFKGKDLDLREIGKQLGAGYVLEGSVRRSQERVRVSAQLVDSRDGTQRWSESYDRPPGDAITIQDEIAAGLARAIQVAVGAADPVSHEAVNPEAYDLYMKARAARDRSDAQGTREAIRYYEEALKIAPDFPAAALGLAAVRTTYVTSGEGGTDHDARSASEEIATRARAAIEAAFKLNPNAPALYGMRSDIYLQQDLDFHAAAAEIDKAIRLAPDDPDTQYYAAGLECTLGRWDAGLERIRVALQQDPFNAGKRGFYASCLLRSGQSEEAEKQARRALAISPTHELAIIWLGQAALARGELAVALDAFDRVSAQFTDAKLAGLAAVYHRMSRAKDSDLAMRQLEANKAVTDPYLIAQAHANRGEFDAALGWLNRAADAKDGWIPAFAMGDPAFTRYKGDPRYRAWLQKVGLAD